MLVCVCVGAGGLVWWEWSKWVWLCGGSGVSGCVGVVGWSEWVWWCGEGGVSGCVGIVGWSEWS